MFLCALTHISRNSAICGVTDRYLIRSSICSLSRLNLRMVMHGPLSASGGMMALTRLPSLSRASTSGLDSSMRRPMGATMRSMTPSTAWFEEKIFSETMILPFFSMKIWLAWLTMISLTSSSARNSSSGPRPRASLSTSSRSMARSTSSGISPSPSICSMMSWMAFSVRVQSSSSPSLSMSMRLRSRYSINRSWMSFCSLA